MDKLKKKYLYLTDLLTSSSSQKLIIFILLGLILIGFGVLAYKTDIFLSGDTVEVLNNTTVGQDTVLVSPQEIVVEISGSVEKPGVYKMKVGDRVDDILIASGGLSLTADRDWVEKNINRASKLSDGQKIYIYSQSEVESAKTNGGIKLDQGVLGESSSGFSNLININTASQSELEKLTGIGPVYAQKMIEHRPYSTKEELVSKGVVSQKVLEKIKESISL
jgi:competence protein ComEA